MATFAARRRQDQPGDYNRHCRADRRPILGATPAERLARLARLRAAIAAAGWTGAAANRHAHRVYGMVAVELLTAEEADELIAHLGRLAGNPVGATTEGASPW